MFELIIRDEMMEPRCMRKESSVIVTKFTSCCTCCLDQCQGSCMGKGRNEHYHQQRYMQMPSSTCSMTVSHARSSLAQFSSVGVDLSSPSLSRGHVRSNVFASRSTSTDNMCQNRGDGCSSTPAISEPKSAALKLKLTVERQACCTMTAPQLARDETLSLDDFIT